MAVAAGAHALGFIFCESPRRVDAPTVRAITAKLPPFVGRVGVFAGEDASAISDTAISCGLDTVQLVGHPDVPAAASIRARGLRVILALRVRSSESLQLLSEYDADAYLLDSYKEGRLGGTGEVIDWDLAAQAVISTKTPVILAGGLKPGNVADAVRAARPFAVDVCSGVEASPGKKDPEKLSKFFSALFEERWRSATALRP